MGQHPVTDERLQSLARLMRAEGLTYLRVGVDGEVEIHRPIGAPAAPPPEEDVAPEDAGEAVKDGATAPNGAVDIFDDPDLYPDGKVPRMKGSE